jgi:hypothetical protein
MPDPREAILAPSVASTIARGAGTVLGSVPSGFHHPALADAIALRGDQLALAQDFWGAVATFHQGGYIVHPHQGNLFEQHS